MSSFEETRRGRPFGVYREFGGNRERPVLRRAAKSLGTESSDRELTFASEHPARFSGIENREIEQAVLTTFLHSQPVGQKAHLRELEASCSAYKPGSD